MSRPPSARRPRALTLLGCACAVLATAALALLTAHGITETAAEASSTATSQPTRTPARLEGAIPGPPTSVLVPSTVTVTRAGRTVVERMVATVTAPRATVTAAVTRTATTTATRTVPSTVTATRTVTATATVTAAPSGTGGTP